MYEGINYLRKMPANNADDQASAQGERSNEEEKTYVLSLHTEAHSPEELILNPELFPGFKAGDYVELSVMPNRHEAEEKEGINDGSISRMMEGSNQPKLVIQLQSIGPFRGNFQISLLRTITTSRDDFQHFRRTFQSVKLRRITPNYEKYSIQYLELSFTQKYVSQGEFWRFRSALHSKSVYSGKSIKILGIDSKVEEILSNDNEPILSGVISPSTKFIFRSGSARLFWLVQMSKEMWDFTEDSELYYERFINGFAAEVFDRWRERSAKHSLTLILFGRTIYNTKPGKLTSLRSANGETLDSSVLKMNYDGRYYLDTYKVVIENETRLDAAILKRAILKGVQEFPKLCGWNVENEFDQTLLTKPSEMNKRKRRNSSSSSMKYDNGIFEGASPSHSPSIPTRDPLISPTSLKGFHSHAPCCKGFPSFSQEGNILEAINLCLNILDKHYIDRDLERTGQAIVLITAGTGVIEVDRNLTRITKQRMMDNAIGCDVVSLTRAPLHITPLFVFKPSLSKIEVLHTDHPFADPSLYTVIAPRGKSLQRSPSSTRDLSQFDSQNDTGSLREYSTSREDLLPPKSSSGLPVYNLPHWIHVCFPYHAINKTIDANGKLRTKFEPIPQNKMFDLMYPNRSGLPLALLQHIKSQCDEGQKLEDVVTKAAKQKIRCPTRQEMKDWYPLAWKERRSKSKIVGIMPLPDSPRSMWRMRRDLSDIVSNLSAEANPVNFPRGDMKRGTSEKFASSTTALALKQDIRHKSILGVFDHGRTKSQEWDQAHREISYEASRGLSRSPGTEPISNVWNPGTFSQANPSFYKMHSSNVVSASTWREQLLSTMEMQLQHDRNVFQARPAVETQLQLNRNPSDYSAGVEEKSNRELNIRKSEALSREPGKIFSYLERRRRFLSQDDLTDFNKDDNESDTFESPREVVDDTSLPKNIEKEKAADDQNGKSILATSMEKTKTLTWDIRRNFGPGMRVSAQNDNSSTLSIGSAHASSLSSPRGLPDPMHDNRMSRKMSNRPRKSSQSPENAPLRSNYSMTKTVSFTSLSSDDELGRNQSSSSMVGRLNDHASPSSQISGSPPRIVKHQSPRLGAFRRSNESFARQTSRALLTSSPENNTLKLATATPFNLKSINLELDEQNLTHNRRRWSHLFPKGRFSEPELKRKSSRMMSHLRYKNDIEVSKRGASRADGNGNKVSKDTLSGDTPLTFEFYRPNWKSLQSPGILPLTTDYCPSRADLDYYYNEYVYSLTLPEQPDDYGYENYDELILEMVSQRLSQDYQLFINLRVASYNLARNSGQNQLIYVCTMGHQVHYLLYNPGTRVVQVKIYLQRQWHKARQKHRAWPYKFLMYHPVTKQLVESEAVFDEMSTYFSWNQLDNLICGYTYDLTSLGKYRRQSFVIMPASMLQQEKGADRPQAKKLVSNGIVLTTRALEDSVILAFQEFLSWLQGMVSKDHVLQVVTRRRAADASSSVPGKKFSIFKGKEHEPLDVEKRIARVELSSSKSARYEWFNIEYDSIFSPYHCYHLQIQWLVASGTSIKEFVRRMSNQAKQAGLILQKIPEYCISRASGFKVRVPHAFILPSVLKMKTTPKENPNLFKSLVELAEERLDLLMDSIVHTAGKTKNLGPRYSLVHIDGYAYIHILETGIIEFIQNRSVSEEANEISTKLFHSFRELCQNVEVAYSAIYSILDSLEE